MPELRWILLGLGVLFCAGLWWWETRRRRQAVDSLKDLAPQDLDSHSLPRPSLRQRTPSISTAQDTAEAETFADHLTQPSLPQRIEPTLGEAVSVAEALHDIDPLLAHSEDEQTSDDGHREKIVSLRLLAPPHELFEGRALVAALHAAGLEHGKFSIFHKYDADGSTLFSVASMVEPGSFDLEHIDERRFRGIAFFTVLQGSGESGLLAMRQTARELAERLHGIVQEES